MKTWLEKGPRWPFSNEIGTRWSFFQAMCKDPRWPWSEKMKGPTLALKINGPPGSSKRPTLFFLRPRWPQFRWNGNTMVFLQAMWKDPRWPFMWKLYFRAHVGPKNLRPTWVLKKANVVLFGPTLVLFRWNGPTWVFFFMKTPCNFANLYHFVVLWLPKSRIGNVEK